MNTFYEYILNYQIITKKTVWLKQAIVIMI